MTVIDTDPVKCQRLLESLDVQAVVGDGATADVLTRCGTSKADLFIAVTANDQVNMLACVLASELGARRRILRLKDIAPLAGYRYFYKHSLGFDVVLSTEELAADEIVNAVLRAERAGGRDLRRRPRAPAPAAAASRQRDRPRPRSRACACPRAC